MLLNQMQLFCRTLNASLQYRVTGFCGVFVLGTDIDLEMKDITVTVGHLSPSYFHVEASGAQPHINWKGKVK